MDRKYVRRGGVYWVVFDPSVGTEIKKTRPALVISADDMNRALPRVIVAPITSKGQRLGCRPELVFRRKSARILLDQLRCIDKSRLGDEIGYIGIDVWHDVLLKMFE